MTITLTASRPALRVIAARSGSGWLLLPLADVVRFSAEEDGTTVHTVAGTSHTVPVALARLEARLPAGDFERISRRDVIALAHISRLEPVDGGLLVVVLRDGTRHAASRQQSRRLRRELLAIR